MRKIEILWVDDEIDILKPHILFLEKKNYNVTKCTNGADAIDLVDEYNFDIVFLDENMPGITGLETLAEIKQKQTNLPVVMITKSEEEYIMEEAIGSKIADYLIKPVNPNQILLSLKKNLDHSKLISEKTTSSYQQEFRKISMDLAMVNSYEEWIDIYKKLKPNKSETQLLTIGKIATSVIVFLGILWIPIMEKIGGGVMYQYLQNVQSYIAPPVTAVFLLGIIWKRVNSDAAITTLFMGLFLLILRLGSEIYFQPQISAGENVDGFLFTFATINFAHMAIILFIFSVILCVSVSLITAEPDYQRTRGLSFGNLDPESLNSKEKTYSTVDVVLSIVLVGIVISILMYFTA